MYLGRTLGRAGLIQRDERHSFFNPAPLEELSMRSSSTTKLYSLPPAAISSAVLFLWVRGLGLEREERRDEVP